MARTTLSEAPGATLIRTLEDAPFYSRSLITAHLAGETLTGVHESFSGPRFASPLTRLMLPFRMPRRP
jgi:carotenoid 1,2-hydratase